MSTIGTQNFDIMRGRPQGVKSRLDVWDVPGLDGFGLQTLGLGDSAFELSTVAYVADSSAADDLIYNCEALQGTVTTIVDDWGVTWANAAIRKVDTNFPGSKIPVSPMADGSTVRVEIHWAILMTQAL